MLSTELALLVKKVTILNIKYTPEWTPQGSGHGTKPVRNQEAFGQHSQKHGLILWSQELDLVIFVGPFQFGIFCDSEKALLSVFCVLNKRKPTFSCSVTE